MNASFVVKTTLALGVAGFAMWRVSGLLDTLEDGEGGLGSLGAVAGLIQGQPSAPKSEKEKPKELVLFSASGEELSPEERARLLETARRLRPEVPKPRENKAVATDESSESIIKVRSPDDADPEEELTDPMEMVNDLLKQLPGLSEQIPELDD